jgi:hypothetical protein
MFHQTPLTASKVGIVYSKATGLVREHIYVENDWQFDTHRNRLHPNEDLCFVDIVHHHAGHDVFHQAIRDSVKAHGNVDAVLFQSDPGATLYRHTTEGHVILADPTVDDLTEYELHHAVNRNI